jgi:formamidopyrimidine-DNA glycosylase
VPELPEVETVVRDLRPLLVGRSFLRIDVGRKALRRKWSRGWEAQLIGQRVRAIERRGKWILIELEDGPHPQPLSHKGRGGPWLVVHLGMTGQFTVVGADKPRETHTHVVFMLDDGGELRFRDVRRFGSITLHPDHAALTAFFVNNRLGPEPFDFDAAYWRDCLRSTRRNLKAILLDQTILAGVGNIYADESLFEAKLHPTLIGADVTAAQARTLRRAVAAVLTRAIEQRGSSIRDYIGGSGLKGQFQDEFCVYGRTGEACVRCRTAIEKITLAGRSTHFCPRCQRKR